jgi:hypothetical protein
VLNGSSSSDSDGFITSHSWVQTNPLSPTANIQLPNTPNPTVTGLLEGVYTFQLTVTDNNGATSSDDVTITVTKAIVRTPTLIEVGNTTTGPGGRRQQIFKVGPNVTAGNKFQVTVFSVTITVIAMSTDTPTSIALKLKNSINSTTASQWNQQASAPINAVGFPPLATSSGDLLTINLNFQNSFFGSASVN